MFQQTEEEADIVITETKEETEGDNLDELTSPPVSRAEVQELFQTWRNPSSVGQRSDDSGVGSNEPVSVGEDIINLNLYYYYYYNYFYSGSLYCIYT